MRLEYRVVVASLTFWGCASPITGNEAPEFGKLKATLNGSAFVGAFGADSVIAIWDTVANQMQIEGEKQVRGRRRPLVRFHLRCAALPKPGNYAIKSMLSPVSAEAILEPTAVQHLWPLHGAGIRAFLSDSMPPGSLVLDTVDSATGIVRGRFRASLRSVNRTPAETLDVRGTFFGRLLISPRFARPRVGRPPLFETDCERIRNAVSM